MPELLLELFSEEIPARMQAQAAEDLKKLVTGALVERGILYEAAVSFVTPRRLALHIVGLPLRQPDVAEERRGPRVGAPEAALAGFLKAAGLASISEASIEEDPKKGSFYIARLTRAGRAVTEVLAEIIPEIVKSFPWPKTMRWGAASAHAEALRWVRPLQGIVCLFGSETEEPEVVPFDIGGIKSGDVTWGHRFMAPAPVKVRRFGDYVQALEMAKVVLDAGRRRDIILTDANNLAFAAGLELVEDEGLLAEVAGLVEWPVALMGQFDEAFLAIPPEVIRATIRANQKCFVLRDSTTGKLSNRFILISNLVASDGGKAIAAGNERVVRARLSDAKFFWESDLKVQLEDRLPKLDSIVFHEKLGTQGQRVKRIMALARAIAPLVGADPAAAERAAQLAKADLTSEMVGEFPELQGLMGRYYAVAQGESAAVAAAVEDHYRPQGPADRIPVEPVSVAVALADKIDTLVGFWAIDEKPTGSKDPYALRRAALGVVRIVLENGLKLPMTKLISFSMKQHRRRIVRSALAGRPSSMGYESVYGFDLEVATNSGYRILSDSEGVYNRNETSLLQERQKPDAEQEKKIMNFIDISLENVKLNESIAATPYESKPGLPKAYPVTERRFLAYEGLDYSSSLLAFFTDRLKIYLRDKGARHDLIDAVFALPGQDDLLMIVTRVNALSAFLDTDDGKNLLEVYKRAANFLRDEEKKDGAGAFAAHHAPNLRKVYEENVLAGAIERVRDALAKCIPAEDFAGAMRALSQMRTPLYAFLEAVKVTDPDPKTRLNRLRLLNELREAMGQVADFGKVSG